MPPERRVVRPRLVIVKQCIKVAASDTVYDGRVVGVFQTFDKIAGLGAEES